MCTSARSVIPALELRHGAKTCSVSEGDDKISIGAQGRQLRGALYTGASVPLFRQHLTEP